MGLGHSPKIVTNNLVSAYDAANTSKSSKGFNTLNSLTDWTLGTGGTATYYQVGLTSENQRILDTGPFGTSTVVWDNGTTDVDSNDDGGFVSSNFNIDPTKLYRFSIWMRRKVIGNGASYLGCHAWDASSAQHVLNRSDNVTNQNPYFLATNYWGNANEWYLVTGHIWPAGSGTGSAKVESGIYTTAGTKIAGTTDFVWQATNTYTHIRSFLYYSTDTTTKQQLYQPRIDLCNGTEPSIADLIAGIGSKWFDTVGNNHIPFVNSAAPYNSGKYIQFDGVDDYTTITMPATTGTISFWYYYNANTFSKLIMGNGSSMLYCAGGQSGAHWFNHSSDYSFFGGWSNASQWLHICLVYTSDTNNSMYINGNLAYSSTSYSIPKGTTYNVAGNYYVAQNCRFGSINIYNAALTAAEVKQNFNAHRGRYGL